MKKRRKKKKEKKSIQPGREEMKKIESIITSNFRYVVINQVEEEGGKAIVY